MSKRAKTPEPVGRLARKQHLIAALARFLVNDQARKSIELEAGNRWAQEWAGLRNASPLFGYPTVEEAERLLTDLLG